MTENENEWKALLLKVRHRKKKWTTQRKTFFELLSLNQSEISMKPYTLKRTM
jgi:hypothetical protein